MSLAQHINEQSGLVNRNPTDGQKKAGNYRKGHVRAFGLDISIENPRGSTRSGTSPNGRKWTSRLPHHYGYIRRTTGGDGDHVDVFVGPHLKSGKVFVIDQHDHRTGKWDEHKAMLGFGSEKQAKEAYAKAFSDGNGRRRIGHVETMSLDGFRDWLRNGDTMSAIHRAAGGGVQWDDGTDVQWDAAPPVPDAGITDAALRGARAGATFNMGDEIEGFRGNAPKGVPELIGPIPARTLVGAAKTGLGYATGDKEMVAPYERERDAARVADERAEKNHPWVTAGAEIAGAIPAMTALPELGAAKAIGPAASGIKRFAAGAMDAAAAAGQYGGLSGAGEGKDAASRAMDAATGIVSGIVGGPLGHAAGTAIGAASSKYGAPIVNTIKGWMDPDGEAARRLAGALRIDQELINSGRARGMTVQQWLAARQAGEPVTLADLGAARTQALLRSAANTSPEGRAQLEQVIEQRFLNQSDRLANTVRGAIPGGQANARKTADQLVAEYDLGRVPAYRTAYQQGDREIMTPTMERLMGSPMVVQAMQRAITSGQDRAITMGMGAFRPGVIVENGLIKFQPKPNGVPTYPNLQYWDAVKRELDDVATKAGRSGEKGQAEVAGNMAKLLRNELDSVVPSYANARGIAEQFFGERNALEAGRKLAGKRADPEEVKAALRSMKPDERALFKEGYASDLAERVIGNMKDTTNVTKGHGIFQTPNERKMAAAIFGPGGMAQLEARMFVESIMDGARQAMGNSTTARQLIEAGLAGGAISGYATGWDPGSMMAGATGLAGARWGKGAHAGLDQIAQSAKHMIGKVDAKTARRVAELLTSNNPNDLRAGYQLAAKSEAIMQGLRNIASRVAVAGQTPARQPLAEGVRALQGPVGARADEQEQRP